MARLAWVNPDALVIPVSHVMVLGALVSLAMTWIASLLGVSSPMRIPGTASTVSSDAPAAALVPSLDRPPLGTVRLVVVRDV